MMAMAAIGAYPDVQAASEGMASFVDRTDPDPEAYEVYGQWAEIQQDIYPALEEIFTRINTVMKRS